ncbi:MAG: winged helix-turn-helix domain-containing protein [Thermoplasmataceae archaeon]
MDNTKEIPGVTVSGDKLIFNSEQWSLKHKSRVEEWSDIPMSFDYILRNRANNRIIVGMKLGAHKSCRISKIISLGTLISRTDVIMSFAQSSRKFSGDELNLISKSNIFPIKLLEENGQENQNTGADVQTIKRSREEIVKQILIITQGKDCSITSIVYKCNLNYTYASKTLDLMVRKKLLAQLEKNDRKFYKATPAGDLFIKNMDKLEM